MDVSVERDLAETMLDIAQGDQRANVDDATPIRHLDPGRPGHRDVILLTWPACRKSEN
jgi:hypothetical protein